MRPRLLLLLALTASPALLTDTAQAAPKSTKPATTAPATTTASSSAIGSAAERAAAEKAAAEKAAVFAEYDAQMASGQKARAADALILLLDDTTKSLYYAEAYAKLGDLLGSMDLPYAALCAYARAFAKADDTTTAEVGTRVPKAIALAQKVGDTMVLEEPFSQNLGLAQSDDIRGQMAYLAAREAFRQENYATAIGMLKLVKEKDSVYPDARMLEAVILNQQGRPETALVALEAVQKTGGAKGERFRDLLAINYGRTFYGAQNYARALQYYGAVSRESEFWPESQFERAWTHFRLNDLNGTLGVLFTLDTPYFDDWYFPEADLLRIYTFFMLCKFPESATYIDSFVATYTPIHSALQGWSGKSEVETFELVKTFVETGSSGPLPKSLIRPYAKEDRFLGALAALKSIDDEAGRLKNASANPFTERARDWLNQRRTALIQSEGARIRDHLYEQRSTLGQMLQDAKIFTLDIDRMKILLLEQAAATGKVPEAARVAERTERTRKGWQEWPFEGEIWADELGYYRVDTPPECPASLREAVQPQ